MYIWKLSVVDYSSPNWQMSACKGDIIIRARNEKQARLMATKDFTIVTGRILGGGTGYSPWENNLDTRCERLDDSSYSTRGNPCVLEIMHPAVAAKTSGRETVASVFNLAIFNELNGVKRA